MKKLKDSSGGQKKILEQSMTLINNVTNFIQPYLHQFFDNFHGLNSTQKPLKKPFDQYQSRLEAISNGQDIRQINW